MDPRSGADCERSECSTDLRKRRPHDRYQTDTAKKKTKKEAVKPAFPHEMDGECVLAFKQNIPFVCTEIHNREHQPHKIPLQAPEPLLSSKRDPCRALLLHMTPGPPGNAVPGALKHTQQR